MPCAAKYSRPSALPEPCAKSSNVSGKSACSAPALYSTQCTPTANHIGAARLPPFAEDQKTSGAPGLQAPNWRNISPCSEHSLHDQHFRSKPVKLGFFFTDKSDDFVVIVKNDGFDQFLFRFGGVLRQRSGASSTNFRSRSPTFKNPQNQPLVIVCSCSSVTALRSTGNTTSSEKHSSPSISFFFG